MSDWIPNFDWVGADLAVGGAFPRAGAQTLAAVHGVGAVVDLRAEDRDDDEALAALGIAFLHLPTEDRDGVALPMLDRGVAFAAEMAGQGRRVLIHCENGVGRSANLALCVLADRGYAPMAALRLLKDRRALVSPSRAQFESWREWLGRRPARGDAPATLPDWEGFMRIAYQHLATSEQ
jgi:predicted protein tyrosine phosphatase